MCQVVYIAIRSIELGHKQGVQVALEIIYHLISYD